jgi:hypothetical protein
MGVFIVHPTGLASITCGQMERADIAYNYQILPTTIDMNEADRIKVTYAPGSFGGEVRSAQHGLVKIKFRAAFKGATQAAAMANFRAFLQGASNPKGGFVEYRPIGLAANVLTTWYEYLYSRPPKLTRSGGLIQQVTENVQQMGVETVHKIVVAEFEMMTKAWATSDPQSPATVVSSASLQNRDDGTYDNHVTLLNSNIKGDAVLPIIRITASGGSDARALVHMRKMIVGANTNLDYAEASGWSTQVDASVSGGSYEYSSGASETKSVSLSGLGMDSTYFGNISAIIVARTPTGTSYTCRLGLVNDVSSVYNVFAPNTIEIDTDNAWTIFYGFGELRFPMSPPPKHLDDSSSPTVGAFMTRNWSMAFDFVRTGGAGNIELDYVVIAKADEFIAMFDPKFGDRLVVDDELVIDAHSGHARAVDPDPNFHLSTVEKFGSPLSDLICMKGHDYRFRVFCMSSDSPDVITQAYDFDVQIDGVYATIYPFEES